MGFSKDEEGKSKACKVMGKEGMGAGMGPGECASREQQRSSW